MIKKIIKFARKHPIYIIKLCHNFWLGALIFQLAINVYNKLVNIMHIVNIKRLTNEPTRRYENEFSSVQFYYHDILLTQTSFLEMNHST